MKKSGTNSEIARSSSLTTSKGKRILVFGMTDVPGGTDRVIMEYVRHLAPSKVHFDFLCNTKTMVHNEEIKQMGSKIYYICNRRKNPIQHTRDLKRFFRQHGMEYDAIWVNISSLSDISYFKFAKKYGIPKRIAHSHSSYEDSLPRRILHYHNKPLLDKYATDFWACSDRAGEWLYTKKIRNSNRYQIIHNAIDVNGYAYSPTARKAYRNRFNVKDNEKVFINVGRLCDVKNQEFAMKIFCEFYRRANSGWLYLIGDGPDRDILKKAATEQGVGERVKFLGARNDVPELLSMSDLFLFPSKYEGLPLALLEAQANGLKCFVIDGVISPSAFVIPDNIIKIAETEDGIAKAVSYANSLANGYDRSIDITKFQGKHYDIDQEASAMLREFCK